MGVNMAIGTFYCYGYGVDRKGLKKKEETPHLSNRWSRIRGKKRCVPFYTKVAVYKIWT